ncbi:rod shape-determining protein MreD [Lachnospiraceae bacterium KM106-2]|nr:rod shape-determining protein MreD [Lachnospiraceae bacterium KM106-2]
MKRFICMIFLIVICFLLQTTVFQAIALANTVPNLLLILIVAIGYMSGKVEGMFLGFFCGLIVDCMYGQVIGISALLYMLVGYLVGICNKIYYRDDLTVPIILVAASDLIFNFCYYVLVFLLRARLNFLFYFRRIMMPELVYTVFVSIVVYKLIHSLFGLLDRSTNKEV